MQDKIKAFQDKYKYLKVDTFEEEDSFVEEGEVPEIDTYYIVSNFNGNKNILITVASERKLGILETINNFV
jgi:hypothetical protein